MPSSSGDGSSVELDGAIAPPAHGGEPEFAFKWLNQIGSSPTKQRPAQASASPNKTPPRFGSSSRTPIRNARRSGSGRMSSPPRTPTPNKTSTTSRYAGELTAMGSPIAAVASDSSDLPYCSPHRDQRWSPPPLPESSAPTASAHPLQHHSGSGPFGTSHDHSRSAGNRTVSPYGTSGLGEDQLGSFNRRTGEAGAAKQWRQGGQAAHNTSGNSRNQNNSAAYSSALMQALSESQGMTTMMEDTSQGVPGVAFDYEPEARTIRLHDDGYRANLLKQQWISLERARQEMLTDARIERDCPFRPTLSSYAARLRRPSSLRPEHRSQTEALRRKLWQSERQREERAKELEECTFRPITTHTLRRGRSLSEKRRSKATGEAATETSGSCSERGRKEEAVFDKLYREAQAKHIFESVVRPQVLQAYEAQQTRQTCGAPLSPSAVAEKVTRLHREAQEQEARRRERAREPEHRPTLSKRSKQLVRKLEQEGERHPNPEHRLYVVRDPAADELQRRIDEERRRHDRDAQRAAAEKERCRLERQRVRSLLQAKYRELSRYAGEQHREPYRLQSPVFTLHLARAAVDLLTPEESAEVLAAVEFCGATRIYEKDFVSMVMNHVAEKTREDPTYASPLCTKGAPINGLRQPQRTPSPARSTTRVTTPSATPQRERPDPEVLERVRARREEQMRLWREEAYLRDNPPPSSFAVAPARLIPYDCRPDIQVSVRTTRSDTLRRDFIARRQSPRAGSAGRVSSAIHVRPESCWSAHQTRDAAAPPKVDGAGQPLYRQGSGTQREANHLRRPSRSSSAGSVSHSGGRQRPMSAVLKEMALWSPAPRCSATGSAHQCTSTTPRDVEACPEEEEEAAPPLPLDVSDTPTHSSPFRRCVQDSFNGAQHLAATQGEQGAPSPQSQTALDRALRPSRTNSGTAHSAQSSQPHSRRGSEILLSRIESYKARLHQEDAENSAPSSSGE